MRSSTTVCSSSDPQCQGLHVPRRQAGRTALRQSWPVKDAGTNAFLGLKAVGQIPTQRGGRTPTPGPSAPIPRDCVPQISSLGTRNRASFWLWAAPFLLA